MSRPNRIKIERPLDLEKHSNSTLKGRSRSTKRTSVNGVSSPESRPVKNPSGLHFQLYSSFQSPPKESPYAEKTVAKPSKFRLPSKAFDCKIKTTPLKTYFSHTNIKLKDATKLGIREKRTISRTHSQATSAVESPNLSLMPSDDEKYVPYDRNLVKKLELKLQDQLRVFHARADLSSEEVIKRKLEVYSSIFAEVILRDKPFSTILQCIKEAYEELINNDSKDKVIKLQKEIEDGTVKMRDYEQEIKFLKKKIKKLSKESVQMGRTLDERERQCMEMQDQMYDISKMSLESIPKTETGWKMLLFEVKKYSDLVSELKSKIKKYRFNEKEVTKLIVAMKKRGYPVQEVYEKDVNRYKPERIDSTSTNVEFEPEEDSDMEPIISGPPKEVPRPRIVPPLKLDQAMPKSSNSLEDSSI